MTIQIERRAKARVAPAGLAFLAVTSIGWGLNWPIVKYVLSEWPPLSARGLTGIAGDSRAHARAKPRGAEGSMVAAVAIGPSQRDGVDDPDGAGAGVVAGERGRRDRLHHAGLGRPAGVAHPRRADLDHENPGAGDGIRRHRGLDGRQRL